MKEFNKWFAQITKEYPMYQDGEGYNIGNTRALMVGWRAALRWVLKLLIKPHSRYKIRELINNELREE